jgi:uncharacterized protein YcbK (DUF882 family)
MAAALSLLALHFSPSGALAALSPHTSEKRLRLFNPKTKTLLETTFWANGGYVPSALSDIDFFMRDLRSGKTRPMDTRLIELLYTIQEGLQLYEPFHVISGFRTRESNDRLRKQGWAAAKNSYHIQGKAVDIRLSNASAAVLRRAAFKLKQGGVGYYPRLNFVHLDMGPVRYWRKE